VFSGLSKARGSDLKEKKEELQAVITELEALKGDWLNAGNCT